MGVLLGSLAWSSPFALYPRLLATLPTRGRDPCPALDFKLGQVEQSKIQRASLGPLSLPWEELPLGLESRMRQNRPGVHPPREPGSACQQRRPDHQLPGQPAASP